MSYKEIETCPITGDTNKITYLDLGMMPLVNNLNNTKEESLNCNKYPLEVNYFPKSGLSMLSTVVDPNILFSHYVYKSGTSKPYIDHCKEMYDYIQKFVKINDKDKFVDIGGNDGTLLKSFKEENSNINVLNIDPSDVTEISCKNGIDAMKSMWNFDVALSMSNSIKVITSTNVFQHTEQIRDFVKGIKSALTDEGIWCLEFPYWKSNMETYQYDQAYHEHIYYYLLTPLDNLFKQEGLEIIDVSEHSIHGGSLRVISKKSNPHNIISDNVIRFLLKEESLNLEYHESIGKKIRSDIVGRKQFINYLKHDKKKIAGFGAVAKGCIFLNSSEINFNQIDYVVDDTDSKQGKFIPGTGIEIVSRERLIKDPPDYLIILAHNFADYIMREIRPIYKGKFIVMFPEIKIV